MPHISLKASMVLVIIAIACRALSYMGRFLCPTLNSGIFPKFTQKTVFFGGSASEEIHLNRDEKLL